MQRNFASKCIHSLKNVVDRNVVVEHEPLLYKLRLDIDYRACNISLGTGRENQLQKPDLNQLSFARMSR